MNILWGEAGKNTASKFIETIGNKTISYVGTKEDGYFIEDILYNAISSKRDISKQIIQILFETEDYYLFITLNDKTGSFKGEDTFQYLKSDFTEETVFQYIYDFILEKDNFYLASQVKDGIYIINVALEEEFFLDKKKIKATYLMSKMQKVNKFVRNNFIYIILILLIITIPAFTIKKANDEITVVLNKKIIQMKSNILSNIKIYEKLKSKIKIEQSSNLNNLKNVLDEPKLFKEFLNLSLEDKDKDHLSIEEEFDSIKKDRKNMTRRELKEARLKKRKKDRANRKKNRIKPKKRTKKDVSKLNKREEDRKKERIRDRENRKR